MRLTRRRLVRLVAGASAAGTLGACAPTTTLAPLSPVSPISPPPSARVPGSWRPLATAGAPQTPTQDQTYAAWTGREMLVWNGQGGALYDPATDRWRPMSTAGAPRSPSAAWMAAELFVWDALARSGARYDPATDRWRPVTANLAPSARRGAALVWTGREVLVFGGFVPGPGSGRPEPPPIEPGGGLYDPATDTWRPIADPGPLPHPGYQTAWTGREAIAWGGIAKADTVVPGVAYDPAADRWRRLPTAGEPHRRTGHALVWTGGLLLVLGGFYQSISGQPAPPLDGGAYEPSTDRWLPIGTTGAPEGRAGLSAVWTGREALLWGGDPGRWGPGRRGPHRDGAAYDPAAGRWRALPTDGAPTARYRHAAVWTGREMLVWGGFGADGALADGAAFRPA